MRKLIEYEITYKDHNVDHMPWYEAQKLVDNPPDDILLIERVTRYGDNDLNGEEYDEKRKYETLYDATPTS